MFHSATLKLTAWYLLILMSISLLFSITIYNAATSEIRDRLSDLQQQIEQPSPGGPYFDPNHRLFSAYRNDQRTAANRNLLLTLLYVNLLIFFGGGALSYLLARRTLRQIEQAHEAQTRFTSDASHELRTPLAAMKAELEVALMDKNMSKTDMHELLESNLEEVNKLTSMSKTLLQLSKLDHANIDVEPVTLNTVASEVVQRYDKNASRIKLKLPKAPLVVKANPSSIEELMTILVDNALKYSPDTSPIKVTLSHSGRNAIFEIINEGEGIPAKDLPHIFDRFYRSDTSRTTGGSGLGLALATDIVTMFKGELSVTSTPGKETAFHFSLPLTK
jgi:signal transduction histidine kinase